MTQTSNPVSFEMSSFPKQNSQLKNENQLARLSDEHSSDRESPCSSLEEPSQSLWSLMDHSVGPIDSVDEDNPLRASSFTVGFANDGPSCRLIPSVDEDNPLGAFSLTVGFAKDGPSCRLIPSVDKDNPLSASSLDIIAIEPSTTVLRGAVPMIAPREETQEGIASREENQEGLAPREEIQEGLVSLEKTQEETREGPATREKTREGLATQEETREGLATREETREGIVIKTEKEVFDEKTKVFSASASESAYHARAAWQNGSSVLIGLSHLTTQSSVQDPRRSSLFQTWESGSLAANIA
jgi:hypothetical protein